MPQALPQVTSTQVHVWYGPSPSGRLCMQSKVCAHHLPSRDNIHMQITRQECSTSPSEMHHEHPQEGVTAGPCLAALPTIPHEVHPVVKLTYLLEFLVEVGQPSVNLQGQEVSKTGGPATALSTLEGSPERWAPQQELTAVQAVTPSPKSRVTVKQRGATRAQQGQKLPTGSPTLLAGR